MTRRTSASLTDWQDDDLPEWTKDQLDRAELAIGDKVVRPATGMLTKAGRPPLGAATKHQVTLRPDSDVIERFREDESGWQVGINETLRKSAGL